MRGILPLNITALVLVGLILFLAGFVFCGSETGTLTKKDVFSSLLPVITFIIGYFIGDSRNGSKGRLERRGGRHGGTDTG
jgi:hypothetical protein